MTSTRSFAGNMVVQIISRAATVVIGLLVVGVMSRSLGESAFGEYTTAFTFLQFFGILVDFGLTITFLVMISEPKADASRIASNLFTMRAVFGVIFYGVAPLFAMLVTPWSDAVRAGVAVGAAAYLLASSTGILTGIFQKEAVMWRAALAELLNRASILAFAALFAGSASVALMAFASVLGNVVWLLATLTLAKPFVRLRLSFDRDVWLEAARRSWPIALSTFFNLIYLRGDILFLSFFRPASDVGLYGLAYRVIDILTTLPVMFMGLLLPALVADWKAGRKDEFARHLSRAFSFFCILGFPIILGAQAVSTALVTMIGGESYATSGAVLQILILSVFGVFFGGLYGWTVVALNEQKRMTWAYAATAALSVIGYLVVIPRFGMWGAVWVTIATETLIGLATFAMVWHRTRALPSFAVAGKALICSIAMYLTLVALPDVHVLLDIAIGCIIYGALMLATGGVKKETLRELLPRRIAQHERP